MGSVTTIPKKYVVSQSTAPSNPFEGQIWRDTSVGTTKQYVNGTWKSIQVDTTALNKAILDNAVAAARANYAASAAQQDYSDIVFDTFGNQDKVSTLSGSATVTGGANGVLGIYAWASHTIGDQSSSYSASGVNGLSITPDQDCSKLRVTPDGNYSSMDIEIREGGYSGTTVKTVTGVSGGSQTEISISLKAGTEYAVLATNYGSTVYYGASISAPTTVGPVTFNGCFNETGGLITSSSYSFNSFEVYGPGSGTGSATSVTFDKGITPSKLIVDADYVNNGSLSATVKDGNGNSTTWTGSELGTEKSVSFTDSNFTIEWSLDTTSGNSEVNDYGVLIV